MKHFLLISCLIALSGYSLESEQPYIQPPHSQGEIKQQVYF
ncbi:hypothetical protein [Motilimonas pumila]|nr:hypothetical protein [Motilimonas pumila]